MVRKEGKIPCNARVDVDYTGKKPKVKFSYTSKKPKKDAENQAGLRYPQIFIWVIIGIIPFFYFFLLNIVLLNDKESYYPSECGNLSFDDLNYTKQVIYKGDFENLSHNFSYQAIYGFNLTCDNKTHIFKFNRFGKIFHFPRFYEEPKLDTKNLFVFLGLFIWFFASMRVSYYLNRILTKYLVKKKWYQKWLPKAVAEGVLIKKEKKEYYKFKPSDVLEKVIIIPKFSNIELDYKTQGDFSKYLERVKIREYRKREINIKTNKIGKLEVDPWTWYAVFYFSQKPEDGYLEVIYQ